MSPKDFLSKAQRALESGRLLLEAGDTAGACNRAYYAMFDAARAALNASGVEQSHATRSHSGLISAFSLHLVKPGHFPLELGRALNRAQELRLVADYTGDVVPEERAREIIQQAEAFVEQADAMVARLIEKG